MSLHERHVFICTSERPPDSPRGSCTARGAADVVAEFKRLVGERAFAGRMRAQKAGCLDFCSHAATVVVHPDAVWHGRVTPADVQEILDTHLVGGVPLQRLMLPPDARRG